MLLASMVADIKGVPICLDAPVAQTPVNFVPKSCFGKLLTKLKVCTKFEVTSLIQWLQK